MLPRDEDEDDENDDDTDDDDDDNLGWPNITTLLRRHILYYQTGFAHPDR